MRLLRIELIGSHILSLDFTPSAVSVSALCIVTGANGSGKSLVVTAIAAALYDDNLCSELAAFGISAIRLAAVFHDRIANLNCLTANACREVQWESVTDEPRSSESKANLRRGYHDVKELPKDLFVPELWRSVHWVRSGKLAAPTFDSLRNSIRSQLRAPLERELAGWTSRLADLDGSDGNGGRRANTRSELENAERELQRVEAMWRQLEFMKERQQDLSVRAAEIRSRRDVIAAEESELTKICGIAERAARVETWIREIHQEGNEVLRLRAKHEDLQTRLDELEVKYRNLPEDFPDILNAYTVSKQKLTEASTQLVELRAERARRQAELEALEREYSMQNPPDDGDVPNEILRDIADVDQALMDSMRGRIELVRQREGLKQQIARDYAVFLNLSVDERSRLDSILRSTGLDVENEPRRTSTDERNLERESKILARRTTLREKYAGFEPLRPSTPEHLRELFDMRRVMVTVSGDLDGLRARIHMLKRKSHPGQSAIWACGSAIAGFAAATAAWSWEIGLFTGLAASGLSLLVFRFIHRGLEIELESAAAAETMIERRIDETRAAKAKLEQLVGPLAASPSYDVAMKRYQDYLRLQDEIADLEITEETLPAETTGASIDLPGSLSDMPLPVVRRLFAAFQDTEAELAQRDEEFSRYESGGDAAVRIQQLEERLTLLREQHAEHMAQAQAIRTQWESRREEWKAHIEELSGCSDGDEITGWEARIAQAQKEIQEFEAAAGGSLSENPDTVKADWSDRENLRSRLREIRSQLSAKQTQDELRAREALLAEEMSEMKQKLGALDPLYLLDGSAADYLAKYLGQLRAVRDDLQAAETRLLEIEKEAENVRTEELFAAVSAEMPLDALQTAVSNARERFEAVERDIMTTRELIALIQDELIEKEATLGAELSSAIDRRIRMFTDGRCLGLEERDGEWFLECGEGVIRSLEKFSDGTRDLIALAIRLGLLDLLGDSDAYPIVWDEALWRLDEANLNRIREELEKMAVNRQIILFTRFSSMESWGTVVRLGDEMTSSALSAL